MDGIADTVTRVALRTRFELRSRPSAYQTSPRSAKNGQLNIFCRTWTPLSLQMRNQGLVVPLTEIDAEQSVATVV
jgi:hypothetical protein